MPGQDGAALDLIRWGLVFGFLPLVWVAGILFSPWSLIILLAMQAGVTLLLPQLSGQSVSPVTVLALLCTCVGAILALWTRSRLQATRRALRGAQQRCSQAEARFGDLEQSVLAQGALEEQLEQAHLELVRCTARLGAVAEVARAASHSQDLDELLSGVVQAVHVQTGMPAAVYLAEGDGRGLELRVLSGERGARIAGQNHRLEAAAGTNAGWCAVHAQPRFANNVGPGTAVATAFLDEIRSEAALPLIQGTELVGVLCVQSPRSGAFGDRERTVLVAIANQLASGIENARLTAQMRRAQRDLAELRRRYVRESWEQFSPEALGYRWQDGELTALGHRPVPEATKAYGAGRTVAESGGALVAPISSGGHVLGALGLSTPDRDRAWSDDEVELVESVAAQMGLVIQNVQLIDEARARLQEITELHRQYLREEWQEFVPTRSQVKYLYAQPGVSPRVELPLEMERVLNTDEPLVIRGTNGSRQSALLTPIALREHVYGALGLEDEGEAREWKEEELAIIDAVTDRVAMAIENARLFAETERRALELQRTAEQLRETDRFRAQFLANMSHELRTPLNSIIGFSRVLLKGIDGPLTDLQKTDLEAIYNNGQGLLNLINDVLDMSKIEAGQMELVVEGVDLNKLVQSVVSASSVLVKDKPIEFRTVIEPELPLVHVDSTRIRQVITNLLSNAVKFTEEGSITLRVWQQEGSVYISVTDTGIGVPEDKIPLLFEQFRQVDSSSTRRAQGTGLGLPISRHFVQMHGGEVFVESQEGVGSTFTFYVPIEGPKEEIPELADLEIDASKRMLLAIERDASEFEAYREHLERDGFQAVPLYSPSEAVRWSRYLEPWVILMDVQFGDDLGWNTLEELCSNRITRQVPVIVCSAEQEGSKAISMGAGAFLPKPVVGRDLLAILSRLER
jgi:signal transduction histidine kinase